MLHNTGPYGPNDVPVNHPNPVNMSQLGGHLNMSHNINNMGKHGQQGVQTASGHYSVPEYTGYSHPPLNMSPQNSHIPTYPHMGLQHFMPQNSTSAHDISWQNGMLPMNLNVQHDHNINLMNYHSNYDKRLHDTVSDDFKETSVRKVPLNIPQIPMKTPHKHINPDNYAYNDNYKYLNHNLDLSTKPQEKLQIDNTRRKNIENTVRLIENILINSSKNKDDGSSYNVNDKGQRTCQSSSDYGIKPDSTPQTSHIYGKKTETTSLTPNIYRNIGSTSESNSFNTKIGSVSESNMYGTKLGSRPHTSNIYGKPAIPASESSNIFRATSPCNIFNTKVGAASQASNTYSSKAVTTSETPNSTKVGSTLVSNIFNTRIASNTEPSNIYNNKLKATPEDSNVLTKSMSKVNPKGILTSEMSNTNNNKSLSSDEATNNSLTSSINTEKPILKSTNTMKESDDKQNSDQVHVSDNEEESSNDESSDSDSNVKPAVVKAEGDHKEILIESKIEIKIENTSCVDMDYFQPFLRDCNGAHRDDVDSKIIDGETSVEEATDAIKNGLTLQGYYECPHCTLLFRNPKRFMIHTKWHTFGLTYEKRMEVVKAKEQRKQQKREAKVLARMNAKDVTDVPVTGKVFACKDCDKVFSAKSSLKNHRKRNHPTRSRDCKICRKTVIGWAAMRAHVATHTCANSGSYQCAECPKRFKYSHSLAKHKDTHLEKTHGCAVCPKMFGSQALLKMHMKTHERMQRGTTYRCTYCGKGFYECYSLQVHERTHRNERPYNCEICNTSFGTNSSLKRHTKVSHSTSKPHECSVCHRSFSTERIRDRHETRVHSQPEDFKFPCKKCSCKYLKLKDLQKHVYKVHPKNKRRKKADSDSE